MNLVSITTLNEVCSSVRYGFTASASEVPCGPKFLRITDIVPDSIIWGSVPYCEIDESDKEKFGVDVNDIVVARTGATVGYAKQIKEIVDAVFASYLVRFRVDPNKAVPEYVGKLVESAAYKAFVQSRIGGAAQPNASAPVLGAFSFYLPSMASQKRAAEVLSTYDDLIENNRRRMALLEESARLLYREWFVRLRFPGYEHTPIVDGVPKGWERKSLGDLCIEVRDMVLPEKLEPDTPYIGLEHIPRRSISLNEWGTAVQVTSSKSQFKAGEIIFGKIRPYFHKVGVAFVDGVASSDSIVIRPNEDSLHGLVLMTMSSDEFIATTAQQMKEGSKMPRADWKQMKAYKIPLPPAGLLSNFDGAIQPIIAQLKTLSFANQKLRAARDLLLPRLMSGEITV